MSDSLNAPSGGDPLSRDFSLDDILDDQVSPAPPVEESIVPEQDPIASLPVEEGRSETSEAPISTKEVVEESVATVEQDVAETGGQLADQSGMSANLEETSSSTIAEQVEAIEPDAGNQNSGSGGQDLNQIQNALSSIQAQLDRLTKNAASSSEEPSDEGVPALPRAHAAEQQAADQAAEAVSPEAASPEVVSPEAVSPEAASPQAASPEAVKSPEVESSSVTEQGGEIEDPFASPSGPPSDDPFAAMAASAPDTAAVPEVPQESFLSPQEPYQAPPPQEPYQAPQESFPPPQEPYQAPQESFPPPQEPYQAPLAQEPYQAPQESFPPPQEPYQAPGEPYNEVPVAGMQPDPEVAGIVDPQIYQEAPIAAQPVPSDDGGEDLQGMNLNIPDDSPLANEGMVDDYTPAYADLDADNQPSPDLAPPLPETSSAPDPQLIGSPTDILVTIAEQNPEQEADQQAVQALMQMRDEAASSKKSRRGGKMVLPPLPFDSLVRGTPLIGTVYSPSGGVGKSSTAMNLAAYIAAIAQAMAQKKAESGEGGDIRVPRVLVLDGDIVQGSLALRLKGDTEPSIHDLILYVDDRKEAGLDGANAWPRYYETVPQGSTGSVAERAMREFVMWRTDMPNLNLLASPEEPDLFYDFGPQEFREILQLLGRFYDVIIIDAGTEIVMESQRAWLAHSNEVFMVTAPEVDRIYNAAKAARYIAKSRPHPTDSAENPQKLPPLATREKLSIVMTRYDADSGIDPEKAVAEYFAWIPDNQRFFIPDVSREMLLANNHGEFLVLNNPDYAQVIGQLAQHLFARYAAERQKALSR